METAIIALMATMNVLLIIVVGVLGYFLFKHFKNKNSSSTETQSPSKSYHPEILHRIKDAELVKSKKRQDLFCPNHPDEPGEATCAICDHLFCKACIKPFKSMHLCKEHLPLIMKNDWEEVLTLKTSTDDPEEGVRLFDVKKTLFKDKNLPTYIETHYKINVDQDYVETYLVLYAIKSELETIKGELNSFQNNN